MIYTERKLYFDPTEIVIDYEQECAPIQQLYDRIIEHEVQGLESLGCQIETTSSHIRVWHPSESKQSFFNRVINISTDISRFTQLCEEANLRTSFEITPFTQPACAEEILTVYGFTHRISSVVLGKEISVPAQLPDVSYQISPVTNGRLQNSAFELFSTFFLKEGEPVDLAYQRYLNNISRGPHFIALDSSDCPVATIGAVVEGATASVYNGIVLPQHRHDGLLTLRLCLEVENNLLERQVDFYYYKTRNRAVAGLAPRYLKLVKLYNERVYEKV